MASTIGRLIASLFSFFRDKFSVNNRNMPQESLSEEAVQDALLALSAVTDFNALREAIREAAEVTLPGVGDIIIYIQDLTSGFDLISTDGLAGAQHTLPKTGIVGKCIDKRTRVFVNGLSSDDPLSGLLPSTTSPLPANRKDSCDEVNPAEREKLIEQKNVLCSPVIDKNQRIVCVIVAVCDSLSNAHEKCFSLLEKHVAVCVHRLQQQGHNNNRTRDSPPSSSRKISASSTGSTPEDKHKWKEEILALCADLHDDSAASMQVKVIRYLEKHTESECCTLLISCEDSSELFCQVLGNKVLNEEIRFMTGEAMCKEEIPCCCFNKVLTTKKSMMLKDIEQGDRKELSKKLGIAIHSILCVPVINQANNNVVAVACAINKINGQGYSQRDEDVIRHCFRYTVPVLTGVLALQKETRLKQETQSMLQVAKNLFTHLGEFYDVIEQWHRHPPELFDIGANIDLFRLCPLDRKEDETRSDGRSARKLSPVSSAEELVESFSAQDEDDASGEEDEEEFSSPDSAKKIERRKRRQQMAAPYVVPRRSPDEKRNARQKRGVRKVQDEWFDASSADVSLDDIKEGDLPDDEEPISGMPAEEDDPWLTDFERGIREMGRDIAEDSDEYQAGDTKQDTLTALRAGQEEQELLTQSLVRRSEEPSGVRQVDSDGEVFSDASGVEDLTWQRFSSRMRSRDSWGNILYRPTPSITVTNPTPEQSPTRPKSPMKWFRSSSGLGVLASHRHPIPTDGHPIPTDSHSGRALLRRQSSVVLQLDWSATTLSVFSIPNPPKAHLEDPYDVRILLREIMQEARNLTQAERCSLFLVENDELVAKVFDGHVLDEMGEVRIPITQGIAGHVATTGKILNILDAYSHPLFYRGVDAETGFHTKNILCFPIKDRSSDKTGKKTDAVVGIAELCNKTNGLYFTKHDEEVAAAFSIYCGISIVHSLLCKKMKESQYRSKLANELMMYHMKVGEEDLANDFTKKSIVPKPESFHPEFAKFCYSPRGIPDAETIGACISMFEDMGMVQRWRINKSTLAGFVILVKRGYRDPPYHNWYHAFSVGHFCYLLYKNISKLNMLDDIEVFSLVVAAICHDLDHRGTNNSFQVHSQSVLAALYSSEGSVMERHHFAQAMCILNTEGCNIFENLSREDYQKSLDLVQDIILATDLAHHLRIIKDLRKMAKDGYDIKDPKCHKLLLCLLMTSADLSDQTKGWQTTKRIAELIYREFFSQGDLEKAMGLQTPEMYDREKACIPELQINFLDHIAMPVYEILYDLFPLAKDLVDGVEANKLMWVKLRHETNRRKLSSTNSLDFFKVPFTCEQEHYNGGSKVAVLEEEDEQSSGENSRQNESRI